MGIRERLCGLFLALALFAPSAIGTEQVPDFLLLDGERVNLRTHPLTGWLEQHPGALPPAKYDPSNNWRRYIATWELDEDKLWLRKVEISVGQREAEWDGVDETWPFTYEDVRAQMFPGRAEVLADWYSGLLIVPRGKRVEGAHERYALLWIRAGELHRRMDLDAKQYLALREERFAAYKLGADYRKRMADAEAQQETRAEHEQHLFDDPEVYLSEDAVPSGE